MTTLWEYREGLAVVKFLSALHLEIASQVRRQVLVAKTIPLLSSTFDRVLRISTDTPSSLPN